MRRQSIPALPLLFALASVFVTSCALYAQRGGNAWEEPTGPAKPAANAPVSTSTTPRSDAVPASSRVAKSAPMELPLDALNGILQKARQAGDRQAEARILGALAGSYKALRQQQKALELYQSALSIWRALGDKANEASTLAHIGDVYREWGFPEQATHFYRDALKLYGSTTGKAEEAAVLNNLGLAYFALHDKKKCLESLDQALAAYRSRQDRQGEAHTLTNLGSTYGFLINDPHRALDYFQQAVTQLELLNDRATEASALELMGGIWLKLQKQDMALQSYQRALSLYVRLGNAQGEASARKQLSAVGSSDTVASTR